MWDRYLSNVGVMHQTPHWRRRSLPAQRPERPTVEGTCRSALHRHGWPGTFRVTDPSAACACRREAGGKLARDAQYGSGGRADYCKYQRRRGGFRQHSAERSALCYSAMQTGLRRIWRGARPRSQQTSRRPRHLLLGVGHATRTDDRSLQRVIVGHSSGGCGATADPVANYLCISNVKTRRYDCGDKLPTSVSANRTPERACHSSNTDR